VRRHDVARSEAQRIQTGHHLIFNLIDCDFERSDHQGAPVRRDDHCKQLILEIVVGIAVGAKDECYRKEKGNGERQSARLKVRLYVDSLFHARGISVVSR